MKPTLGDSSSLQTVGKPKKTKKKNQEITIENIKNEEEIEDFGRPHKRKRKSSEAKTSENSMKKKRKAKMEETSEESAHQVVLYMLKKIMKHISYIAQAFHTYRINLSPLILLQVHN